jgi:hypothetical protein
MRLLAIDPGYEQTAVIGLDGARIHHAYIASNDVVLDWLYTSAGAFDGAAIEMVACYGMAAGKELFETCVWIGRFMEAIASEHVTTRCLVRMDVKMHLCHNSRAGDSNIRAALIDRYGGESVALGGVKCSDCKGKGWRGRGRLPCVRCESNGWEHAPGPLHGIKADLWAALAVGVTAADTVFAASVPAGVEGAA